MKKYPGRENADGYIDFRAWKKGQIFSELYKLGYDAVDAAEKFQSGPVSEEWDRDERPEYVDWAPRAAAQGFVRELREEYGVGLKSVSPREEIPVFGVHADSVPLEFLEWAGKIYEMIAAYSGISGKEAYRKLSLEDMYDLWEYAGGSEPYSVVKNIAKDPQAYRKDISAAEKPRSSSDS